MFTRIQEARSKQKNLSPFRSAEQSLSGLFSHFLKLARADKSLARLSSTPVTLGNAPAGYEALVSAHIIHWRVFFPGKTLEHWHTLTAESFRPEALKRSLVVIWS